LLNDWPTELSVQMPAMATTNRMGVDHFFLLLLLLWMLQS